jgi:glycerol-3-phosphate O-acyltransferase
VTGWLRRPAAYLAAWARPTVNGAAELPDPAGRHRLYALEQYSALDVALLRRLCREEGLPPPVWPTNAAPRGSVLTVSALRGGSGRRARQSRAALDALLTAGIAVEIVPVSLFWGRAPRREGSLLRLLLAERWRLTGQLRRLAALAFDRHGVFVTFGSPIALDPASGASARHLLRLSHGALHRQRTALLGPDLSHRSTLVDAVLDSDEVQACIAREAGSGDRQRERLQRQARRHALEMVSDLDFRAVRFFDLFLHRLWNQLYDGIEVQGAARLKAAALGNIPVYVPCHRSHIDYLLLSYVLYYNGLMLPHVAAGRNLNVPWWAACCAAAARSSSAGASGTSRSTGPCCGPTCATCCSTATPSSSSSKGGPQPHGQAARTARRDARNDPRGRSPAARPARRVRPP